MVLPLSVNILIHTTYSYMKTLNLDKIFNAFGDVPPQERISKGMDLLFLVSSLTDSAELKEPYRTHFCYAAYNLLEDLREYDWQGEERILLKFKKVLLDYFSEKEDYEKCSIVRDYAPLETPRKKFIENS